MNALLLLAVAASSVDQSNDGVKAWVEQLQSANRLFEERRYENAEKQYRVALDSARKLATDELPSAITLDNLAYCRRAMGRLADAAREFSTSLGIMERRLGPVDHRTVNVVVNLTSVLVDLSQLSRAEVLVRRYLNQAAPLSEGDRATLSSELGAVLVAEGHFAEAEPRMRAAVQILAKDPGKMSQEQTVSALSNLALLYVRMNRLTDALEYSGLARALLLRIDQPTAILSIKTLANSAAISVLNGNLNEALSWYESALELCARSYGSEHFVLGRILPGYAELLRRLRRKAEARSAEKRAKAILQRFQTRNQLGYTVDARAFSKSPIQP